MANVFDVLIGKMITSVSLSDYQELIEFVDHNGVSYIFQSYGDCCNNVWFNHVSGLECLLGQMILKVDEKPWINVDATIQEYDKASFWTFHTTKGYFDFEVRNSSNGYYSGWVKRYDEVETDLKLITDDF